MSDLEFDIIDELYFVTSYKDLQEKLNLPPGELENALHGLVEKGWVNYFTALDGPENPASSPQFPFSSMYFLASKKGLMAHNSK